MVKRSARRTRRTHTPAFRAQVAVATWRRDKALAELVKRFELHPNRITEWRRQLLKHAGDAFDGGAGAAAEPVDLGPLHPKIDQLTPENEFLERALTKTGLLSAKR